VEVKEIMEEIEKKARALRAEYHRAWRRKNPERVAAINYRYWLKKARRMAESGTVESEEGDNANE